jgi:hypothetical protein
MLPEYIQAALRHAKYEVLPDDGRHVVVVVVSELARERHWIVTAYITRKLAQGEVEWRRS